MRANGEKPGYDTVIATRGLLAAGPRRRASLSPHANGRRGDQSPRQPSDGAQGPTEGMIGAGAPMLSAAGAYLDARRVASSSVQMVRRRPTRYGSSRRS
jgi:hypothetical protein